ncbi:MAG TPA: SRPBCC family protein [Longimicrobium sp.]|nr:SRPBCC family protein [Longimicrobium sp.]
MIPDRIEREIHIAAPAARVWRALTEARHLGTWFGDAGATIDLRPGGAITLTWKKVGTTRARVVHVEPPRLFSFRWVRGRDEEPDPDNSTLVEFTLADDGGGTRLRVVESGIRTLQMSEEELTDYASLNGKGWTSEMAELQAYVPGMSE